MSPGPPQRIHGRKLLVMPGSFNPLHSGHLRLAKAARELCKHTRFSSLLHSECASSAGERRYGQGTDLVFEMSMENADKGEINIDTARFRLRQFALVEEAVLLTRLPLYVEKAAVVGPCDFVVGADTASRILDPKYYNDGVESTLDQIRSHGCGFVVAGRVDSKSGQYVAADASLVCAPPKHREIFVTLTESVPFAAVSLNIDDSF